MAYNEQEPKPEGRRRFVIVMDEELFDIISEQADKQHELVTKIIRKYIKLGLTLDEFQSEHGGKPVTVKLDGVPVYQLPEINEATPGR